MARQATDNGLAHALFLPYVVCMCLIACVSFYNIIESVYLCYAVTQKRGFL